MPKQEGLAKYEKPSLAHGTAVRHVFTVVSDLESQRTVQIASNVVKLGHRGQIPNMHNIALEALRNNGKPVDAYEGSTVIDLQAWKEKRVFGQYQEGEDTFAYTEFKPNDEVGSERVETVAFTSKTRQQVRASLGEPNRRAS